MKKIYVIHNGGKLNALTCVKALHDCLADSSAQVLIHEHHRAELEDAGDVFIDSTEQLLKECDVVVAIGGDGTIIHAAKLAAQIANKPVLGINAGRLGFTAGLEMSEIGLISQLISGDYTVENRMMLDVSAIDSHGNEVFHGEAINDAVIARGMLPHIIDLRTYHNERLAMQFRAAGLIISTPTGSTAYSLSAGGPAIDPHVKCIMTTPVCAHSLHTRPIIFSHDSVIKIETKSWEAGSQLCDETVNDSVAAYLTVDGEESFALGYDHSVIIKESSLVAQFIVIKKQSFAEVFKQKFTT